MNTETTYEDKASPSKRFVLSLSLASFATFLLDVFASLFLATIALTFFGSDSNAAVGAASQIVVFSSVVAIFSGLLSGVLSVRFSYKFLLLLGIFCIFVGAVGCYLAPSFLFLLIFYPLDGVGTIMVIGMAIALIGTSLPLEKRPKAISWVVAGATLSGAFGFPIAGFIAGIAGWRSYLLVCAVPISVAALVLAFFNVPNNSSMQKSTVSRHAYLSAFKQVLLNKSATACLIGHMLLSAATVWSLFAATFWIKQFELTVQNVGILTMAVTLVYALGSIIGGRLVNKVGRKLLAVSTFLLRGSVVAAIVFMPNFLTALAMSFFATFVGGLAIISSLSLSLEQAPNSRGMMMSITGVFGSLGVALGASAGGFALSQLGYQMLGVTFGIFGVAASSVIFFLAKDPCK